MTTHDIIPAPTAGDQKVLIGLTHSDDEPENVLIAYLIGVEALRAGKEAVMWLTKDGVDVAVEGFADKIADVAELDGAPSIRALHAEYVESGGRFLACPVCVKLRGLGDSTWTTGAEVAGVPAVFAYTEGGALVFNY